MRARAAQARSDEKQAKKVEKREKKLMRPGFEGHMGGAVLNPPKPLGGDA